MAVSFKVPASPKKNIFNIDTFTGVDLTSTETSVDDDKSPNAENMVRLVPGKVRKRTGYKTKILFSDGTDVNRVIGSTDKYVDIDVEHMGDTLQTATVLAEFYDLFPANSPIFFKFIVSCVGDYYVDFDNGESEAHPPNSWHIIATPESPKKDVRHGWTRGMGFNEETKDLRVYRGAPYQEGDYFRIKEIMICTKASTSRALDMPWSVAPEERGAKYVKRDDISPVFGSHVLKTYDANRVVNVNRALNTSDSFESYTVSDSTYTPISQLAEAVYCTADYSVKTRLYVEMDYVSDGQCIVSVGGWQYSTSQFLEDTSGATAHYSMNIGCGEYAKSEVSLKAVSGTANVQVKNISVMYQKDSSYSWSPAPEDTGGTFHIEDIYESYPNNYALNETWYYSDDSSSLTATCNIPIGNALIHVLGFAHISFDLETSTSQPLSKIYVRILSSSENVVKEVELNENLYQSFDFYLGSGASSRYFKTIQIEFHLDGTDATCLAYAKNIQVRQIQPRPSYNIVSNDYIYHVGKDFYLYSSSSEKITKLDATANQRRSMSWQLNDNLMIIDGKTVFRYKFDKGLEDITSGIGYIPTISIGRLPGNSPGGHSYEALNLIQPAYTEKFTVTTGTANESYFRLSFKNNDRKNFIVEVLNSSGNWVKKTINVDYYENYSEGWVYFLNGHLPGVSPVQGEDNVRITAYRTVDGYADRIRKCTVGTLFGVGGAADRLFLSGNPDHPNWDFYSKDYDPTYFPDTGYSVLGSAASAIVGYAVVNNYLATFKDEFDQSQNVTIREGDLVVDPTTQTSEPAFKIINTLQGGGVIAPYSFAYLQTEPLFLTRSGICAITPQDITGERYSQNRSFYLNGKLLKEDNLDSAMATVFDDQYILAVNRKLYILDGIQPIRTDKSMPYSTRQYAGFLCTNIPSSCIWTDNDALWVGTYNGKVCRFDTDIEDLESYNDDGEAIYCCWETPDLDGRLFYKNKTFRYFAIRIMNALRTSCKLSSKKLGQWTLIKEDAASGTIFDFELIDFERFSFNTDTSAKVIHTKVRVKKVDKAQFRVESDKKNEPFGLFDLALEYVESGNYKG